MELLVFPKKRRLHLHPQVRSATRHWHPVPGPTETNRAFAALSAARPRLSESGPVFLRKERYHLQEKTANMPGLLSWSS